MNPLENKKVAIVYDRLNKFGGAERVLTVLHEMFPDASIYSSVFDEKRASWARVFPKIETSFLQRIGFARKNNEFFGWLMPLVFETFDFSNYDIVISVTSEAAKGIITRPPTFHFSYILTPTRYLWSHTDYYFENPLLKIISKPLLRYLRKWDKIAAFRPDFIVSVSQTVKKRIKKYYGLDSLVLYPPSDSFKMLEDHIEEGGLDASKYYLIVSRLVGYKKIDLAINVFNKLGLPLIIVGTGKNNLLLKLKAGRNIIFLKKVDDLELVKLYKNAKALIMPQEEDFGIVSVEAQSLGVPVIAYNAGGAKETVVDGVTGVLFDKQNEASLMQAIAKFEKISFNHSYLVKNAKKFNKERFKQRLHETLVRAYSGRRWGN